VTDFSKSDIVYIKFGIIYLKFGIKIRFNHIQFFCPAKFLTTVYRSHFVLVTI
jgi:hypothetical protein